MAILLAPIANTPFVDSRGYLTTAAVQTLQQLSNQAQSGAGGALGPTTTVTGLGNYANDAAAKAAGVPQWGLYWNNSVLSVRRLP